MKLIIKKDKLKESPENFLKKVGFTFIHDRITGKDSFVRRLGSEHYPRLHLYIMQDDDKVVFDLHFDQKKVSYEGANMHNAEYDGEIVETEINRLKDYLPESYVFLKSNFKKEMKKENFEDKPKINKKISLSDFAKAEDIVGSGTYERGVSIDEKKVVWWKRLFS